MAVITEESKHGAGADLCGLSLVKQERANGLERTDSKVNIVEVSDGSGVCLNRRSTSNSHATLGIKVFQVQVKIYKRWICTRWWWLACRW